jgi:hypothetical protein
VAPLPWAWVLSMATGLAVFLLRRAVEMTGGTVHGGRFPAGSDGSGQSQPEHCKMVSLPDANVG